ncbi:MAG: DNA polymerase domain-containing protein [Candidatus Thorarchaeota archaeon]
MPENRGKGTSGMLDNYISSKKSKKKKRQHHEKKQDSIAASAQDTVIETDAELAATYSSKQDSSEPTMITNEHIDVSNGDIDDFEPDSELISEENVTNCMFLIGTEYNATTNKARLKFYDLETQKLLLIDDPTGHEPYLITIGITPETIVKMFKKHVTHAEIVELTDLLNDGEIKKFTKAYTVTPSDVPPVRGSLSQAWEAKIRYHLNWICDRQVTPGLTYKVDHTRVLQCSTLKPIEPSKAEKAAISQIEEVMGESDLLSKYLPFFLTPIPEIKAAAIDIETDSREGRIPKPEDPRDAITCICLVDTDGKSWAFCLTNENKSASEIEKELGIEGLSVVQFFWKGKNEKEEQEKALLEAFFQQFRAYPFIISFNGDLFDFPYLDARARKLGVKDIPITYNRRRQMSFFSHAVHIDTYKWYQNPAIRIYAHSAAYSAFGLDTVARALIGKGKIDLDEAIWDLPLNKLIQYCWNDTKITLELLTFDDFTPFKLMMLLARICHMPLEELLSSRVSTWLQNLFYYEHRRRNILIPNQKDIAQSKGTTASSKAITEGKRFEGAIVIDPTPGLHFDVKVLDFASLYPSIISTRNLSYETMMCGHPDCKTNPQNHIPDTDYYVCSKRRGILAEIIGFLKDIRVLWFKPFSKKKEDPDEKKLYSIIEKSLKVLVNACLPFEEEVIVKDSKDNRIYKRQIGSLEDDWQNFEVLSVKNGSMKTFGKPEFVPIIAFSKRTMSTVLKLTLADGRCLRCTPNHVIPRLFQKTIDEVSAGELKINDEIFVLHQIPLSSSPPNILFIPNLLNMPSVWIGVKREDYKRISYKRNQKTNNPCIRIINKRFNYSKCSKWYKSRWKNLSKREKAILEKERDIPIHLKVGDYAGHWYSSQIPLNNDFFSFLGWFIAEGSVAKNRVNISQYKKYNLDRWQEIKNLLDRMNITYRAHERGFEINSIVLSLVMETLCGRGAENKRISIDLFDKERAKVFLESYFKGDGNWDRKPNKTPIRRYSTKSPYLANDLVTLLGATNKYASIHRKEQDFFRITETQGRNYKRKYEGLVNFNGITPVRIKDIEVEQNPQIVFDLQTGNGWFVTTNGITVHNSYGVLGAAFFNFFCMSSAESTTAVGRYAIMQAIEKCNNLGIDVLYGDTDSVFLANPSDDQVKALIDWSEHDLQIGLDVDKAYRYVAFSKRKKNYVGVLTDGSVDIKGLMVKKSNTPLFIQQAFREVMEILQGVETREEFKTARKSIHGIVKECKTRLQDNGYSAEELAISVQMTKTIKSYKVASQHIKAAKQLEEYLQKIREDNSYYLKPGTIIRFVKTDTTDGVTPLEVFEEKKPLVDMKAYETQLESTFTQVLDTLGITLFDSQKRARRQFKSLTLNPEDLKKEVNLGEMLGRKKKS